MILKLTGYFNFRTAPNNDLLIREIDFPIDDPDDNQLKIEFSEFYLTFVSLV